MTQSSRYQASLAEFTSERDVLEFRTWQDWTANDLGIVMTALDGIYSTFLLTRRLAVIANKRNAESFEDFQRYGEEFGDSPFFFEWSRMLRRFGARAALSPFMLTIASQDAGGGFSSDTINYYFANPSEYMPAANELHVERIQMASPGGFSLKGLGEPLKELRELIKDLFFRNKLERQQGELEILEKKLQLLSDRNLHPQQIQILAISMVDDCKDLSRVIDAGKLTIDRQEPITPEPTKALPSPRRGRKRKGPEQIS